MSRNFELQTLAHNYIPGGAHTYSRGDDQFPSNAPRILSHGKGAYVWDVDGNKFLDYGMALRSVTLGYSNERVNEAAIKAISLGNNLTRASEVEVLAAKDLCELIPWCEMVKFAKNGSTVVSAAAKLARAFTGRKLIARCADHPFFSFDDWFIGDTVVSSGVPKETQTLTLRFNFNDLKSVQTLFEQYPSQIACVILEPSTAIEPEPGFLDGLIHIAHKNGALVILDEMISGFRWHIQGACKYYNVTPDLVTYGKAMGNGFSVAALGGRREIMELGGISHSKERVFLISTTHGAEMCGLAAFREILKVYQEDDVCGRLWNYGNRLIQGMTDVTKEFGIEQYLGFEGAGCSPQFVCKDRDRSVSLSFRTLFVQEMLKGGVLMPWLALSTSHGEEELDLTLFAAKKAILTYSRALESGIEHFLEGKVVKPVFRKYN